jgi:hypothetical protein
MLLSHFSNADWTPIKLRQATPLFLANLSSGRLRTDIHIEEETPIVIAALRLL